MRIITTRFPSEIHGWLIERVATYLDKPPVEIDPTVPLAECGIDSTSALGLCGDIEDEWQLEVDATLVYDYPTIQDIATYLDAELATRYRRAA